MYIRHGHEETLPHILINNILLSIDDEDYDPNERVNLSHANCMFFIIHENVIKIVITYFEYNRDFKSQFVTVFSHILSSYRWAFSAE